MTWSLLAIGILLAVLGLWGGPAPRRKEVRESRPKGPMPKGDAWDILTQPVVSDEELIKIPERRPWFIPGRAGRFQRGLMLGLGLGLLIGAGVYAWAPRSAGTQAPQATPETTTNKPAPGTTTPTSPAKPTTPPPAPPKPANVGFEVAYGDTVPAIASNLKAKGLITDEQAFMTRATERGADTLLKAGTFTIPTGATIDQILDVLTQ